MASPALTSVWLRLVYRTLWQMLAEAKLAEGTDAPDDNDPIEEDEEDNTAADAGTLPTGKREAAGAYLMPDD